MDSEHVERLSLRRRQTFVTGTNTSVSIPMCKFLFGGRAKGNEKIYKTFDTERREGAPPSPERRVVLF